MKRTSLYFFLLLGATGIFIARLFYIQLIDERYTLNAANNAQRIEKVFAPRGVMLDRNGQVMASNQIAYDVEATPRLMKDVDTVRLAFLLGEEVDRLKRSLRKAKVYSPFRPSAILRGLTANDYARIQEEISFYPGIQLRRRILRKYITPTGGNVLGYVSEVNDYLLSKKPEYEMGDYIGISGIEASYEENLRGRAGRRYITVDNLNRDVGPLQGGKYDQKPVPGENLTLTLDATLQAYGELLMSGKRGSIVAIEPQTGEILALVSAPNYDPNALVGRYRSRNYSRLYTDSINKPLYDRGILAEYPPGSPFKVLNALIALQEGVVSPATQYTCIDGYHFGRLHVGCHCKAGTLDLRGSISKSCNNYHCQILKKTLDKYPTASQGLDQWNKHVTSFGLGQFLGVDLPTGRKGFVPNGAYYNRVYRTDRWKSPTVISLAIGQGELVVTPIQLANVAAAMANRGYWYTPHVVRQVGSNPVDPEIFHFKHMTTIDPEHFDVIIQGMADVFESGTARASRLEGLPMAGKTGTAENPHGQDHSIFMAFAPVDNPKIALAIIVENGYWGSRWAAPIASLMMEQYIHGQISRPALEKTMVEGSLVGEYRVQSVKTELPPY
ncbi:MAG: penicillin-binding protein 2 [Schleiferiaceae bacterium]|jgi:penicillin-binding protein 2|nr:MAG: penicillin-binding protein [Cryomorphaceae bacterium BACL23 MAG-120924-bin60]MBL6627377.1 penicillin-binding protein 2 [Cryomorphaceae bacterium]NCZ94771.1 penicillin-binding protein 2 [Flavobacteriia bacterium]NDA07346.1 penicillin-binding protein 2 [Flavobacteriia bacterium]NDD19062.1 penicillin-binding protein 2 [Flavobacteriia bacterium]